MLKKSFKAGRKGQPRMGCVSTALANSPSPGCWMAQCSSNCTKVQLFGSKTSVTPTSLFSEAPKPQRIWFAWALVSCELPQPHCAANRVCMKKGDLQFLRAQLPPPVILRKKRGCPNESVYPPNHSYAAPLLMPQYLRTPLKPVAGLCQQTCGDGKARGAPPA